ncbi:MAG TPA: SPOR domain-containing protein [Desulfuromonadaceae bacterium]|jgi:hypothetical protein
MDFKFNKDSEDSPKAASPGNKGNQNILLVVLLVLVAGFAYIYFFTGLIKPQVENKPAEPPAPQVVKNPLPPRSGDVAKGIAPAAVPGAPKELASPTAEKPEPPKVAQAIPAPVAPKESPKDLSKKLEPPKTEVKKPLPQPAQKPGPKVVSRNDDKKQAPEKKQPKIVEQKVAAAPKPIKPVNREVVKKPLPVVKDKQQPAKEAQGSGVRFTVVVGSYLLEDALAPNLALIRKAGLEASVTTGARKKTTMNRLLLGEYKDRNAAQAELEKLKRYTSDAFIMDHAGKPAVYAGSYLLDERASSEKERLAAAGFSLALKKAEVAIPTKKLTAGTFTSKKAAEAALKKLKDAGVKSACLSAQ